MKRLKTLGIILLVFFFGSLYQGALLPILEGIKYGMTIAKYQIETQKKTDDFVLMDVETKNKSFMEKSETNLLTGEKVLTRSTNMTILIHQKSDKPYWWSIIQLLYFICSIIALGLYIWIPFLIVKVIRSLQHSEVFDRKNLTRINRIGIILLSIGVLGSLLQVLNIFSAQELIDLTNYRFTFSKVIDFNTIIMGVVILIMNEILRFGTEMKEEQDLTI